MVPTRKEQAGNGSKAVSVEIPRSVAIASCGLDTAPQIAKFATTLAQDVMSESVGHKTANAAISALRLAIRAAEYQQRYGSGGPAEISGPCERERDVSCDPLKLEEAKLLAQLEQVRKELAAR